MNLIHCTHAHSWRPYEGACFTRIPYPSYGRYAIEVTIYIDGLVILEVEVSREDRDDNNWPGDRASVRAAYAAAGVDVLVYQDEDTWGHPHRTWRIVSDRAVASCAVTSVTDTAV